MSILKLTCVRVLIGVLLQDVVGLGIGTLSAFTKGVLSLIGCSSSPFLDMKDAFEIRGFGFSAEKSLLTLVQICHSLCFLLLPVYPLQPVTPRHHVFGCESQTFGEGF